MKYWVRFSRTIFKLAALPFIKRIEPKSLESVLKNSLQMINEGTAGEIRQFIRQNQTSAGGFADRAGKSDLYYSLFGYFLAEAYSVQEVFAPLRKFIKNIVATGNLSGVNLYCAAILYAGLNSVDDQWVKLAKQIKAELNKERSNFEYSSFMGFLALYYLGDFFALRRLINLYRKAESKKPHACPLAAANAVLLKLGGHQDTSAIDNLKSFYRKTGGFAALPQAPCEDLLSTGVALYALHFLDADIRLIKADCLSFVDDLYDNGGFRATQTDFITDVEYTFYGLLALGSLHTGHTG